MKVLVTGGAGYIGSITVKQLLAAGHEIVVYDNLSTGFREAIPSEATFVFGDIRDGALLARVMKDRAIDAVIHFAAKLVVPESVKDPLAYYDVNVAGGLQTLKAAAAMNVKAFVFSSTAAVYGNPTTLPVTEEATPAPMSPYGESKLMIERALAAQGSVGGFPYLVLRYFNVAGAAEDLQSGQRTLNATHLVKVAAEVACGKRVSMDIYGEDYPTKDGTGVRDYIHVEDLAAAHVLALQSLVDGKPSGILNCGYGVGFSVREVIAAMEKVSGQKLNVRTQARRAGDPAEIVADSSRLKARLGWKPRFDRLDEICRSALAWEKR